MMKQLIVISKKRIYFLFLDLAAFYLSLYSAFILRVYLLPFLGFALPRPLSFSFSYYAAIWWLPVIYIYFIASYGLYTKRPYFWDELGKLWKMSVSSVFVSFAVVSVGKMEASTSRAIIAFLFAFSLLYFPLLRYYGKIFLFNIGIWKEPALIVGAGRAGQALLKGLKREKTMGYEIVGFLDDYKTGSIDEVPVVGKLSDAGKLVRDFKVNTIFIAIPSLGAEKVERLFSCIWHLVINVFVVPDIVGFPMMNSDLYYIFYERTFLLYSKNELLIKWRKFIKRAVDLVVVCSTFPVTLPVTGILALLVILDSKGSPFYISERIGEGGKLFRCIKLRTMYKNADEILEKFLAENEEEAKNWEKFKKIKGKDPRVTRVGRFLRATSLDELPQIFNVLKGEMSIVGPRPYLPRERKDMEPYFDTIVITKPGITGLWQVSGRNDVSFTDRMKLDVWYVRNWSLWLDFIILLKTIKVVLKKEGAY